VAEKSTEWAENQKNEGLGTEPEGAHVQSTVPAWLLGRTRHLNTARLRTHYLEQVLRSVWLHAEAHPKSTLYAADVAQKIVRAIHVIQLQGEEAREAEERMEQIEARLAELVERQEQLRGRRLQ